MLADVAAAARQTLSAPFRAYLWKSLGATLALFALCAALLAHAAAAFAASWPLWAGLVGGAAASVLFILGAGFLLSPVTALVASFYADRLAELVEADLGTDMRGRAVALGPSLRLGLRFAIPAAVLNAIAFVLWLAPGLGLIAFLAVNSYLFGRMTFEMVALRHGSAEQGVALFHRHSGRVVAYGVWIALLLAIPLANFLTPMFSVALMARAYDRLARAG